MMQTYFKKIAHIFSTFQNFSFKPFLTFSNLLKLVYYSHTKNCVTTMNVCSIVYVFTLNFRYWFDPLDFMDYLNSVANNLDPCQNVIMQKHMYILGQVKFSLGRFILHFGTVLGQWRKQVSCEPWSVPPPENSDIVLLTGYLLCLTCKCGGERERKRGGGGNWERQRFNTNV